MSISLRSQKMLWGRAASRCSICRCNLVIDETELAGEALIGDVCHIVAQKEDGPRGVSDLIDDERDEYQNLILLCKNDHKLIDDQVKEFPVDKLKAIKSEHEEWVRSSLEEFDAEKQLEDETYSKIIDEWEIRADIKNWTVWTSYLLSVDTTIGVENHKQLTNVHDWIISRLWPGRYPDLEAAFHNFRFVLQDLLDTFNIYSTDKWGSGERLFTDKIYKDPMLSHEVRDRLLKEYLYHIDLIDDLVLELTRAANYICDKVRESILQSYRFEEGALIVHRGPNTQLRVEIYRPEYRGEERTLKPYPGLEDFLELRFERDIYIGDLPED